MSKRRPGRLEGRQKTERNRRVKKRQPLCAMCLSGHCAHRDDGEQCVRAGTQVDHIVAIDNGGTEQSSNLQVLCDPCHAIKTTSDLGHKPRQTVGADGWPVEAPALTRVVVQQPDPEQPKPKKRLRFGVV
jgi:5-methylcytosine-specific restriction protein A